MRVTLLVVLLAFVAACSSPHKGTAPAESACASESSDCNPEPEPEPDHETAPETTPSKSNLQFLRDRIDEVTVRDEISDESIQVQHLLVGVKHPRLQGVSRTVDEAELLAADLYARLVDGSDFDELIKEYTNDSAPGIYGMTTNPELADDGVYLRNLMVAAFGNVGYRLEVGEISVAPYDEKASPYGFHIIKRLK
ncbi:MAG: peptidylprolyl isomerase [Planctomycetota bacterium]|jgi:hypothetical protein